MAIVACLSTALAACGHAKRQSVPVAVTKASFEASGKTWPLSVAAGTVGCSNHDEWWFEARGVRYGLNEHATPAKGYAALDQIWESQLLLSAPAPGSAPPPASAPEAAPGTAPPDPGMPRQLRQTPQGPQENGLTALLALAEVLC